NATTPIREQPNRPPHPAVRRQAGAGPDALDPRPPSSAPRSRTTRGRRGCRPNRFRRPQASRPLPADAGRRTAARRPRASAVVVEGELRRVGTQAHHVRLVLTLVVDPGSDQLLAEDATGGEELMIRLERVERLLE